MIKEAIEKIVSLADKKIYQVGKDFYTNDSDMELIEPHIYRPLNIDFSSLDAIVKAIQTELKREEIHKPVFISVTNHNRVKVFTTLRRDNQQRDYLYSATADLPQPFPQWSKHEDAIIMLRSQFVQNEDTQYLLDLLSRISNEDNVSSEDNGVSQKVTATTGVALKQVQSVKARVSLAPFRTFFEVDQPESEFILRLKPGDKEKELPAQVGIIEADGGAWKLAAKHNIADFFRGELAELIRQGQVVVVE